MSLTNTETKEYNVMNLTHINYLQNPASQEDK